MDNVFDNLDSYATAIVLESLLELLGIESLSVKLLFFLEKSVPLLKRATVPTVVFFKKSRLELLILFSLFNVHLQIILLIVPRKNQHNK